MYKELQDIETPDEKEIIWRYMDFTSFVSILHDSTLHFTRVDQLDDPFEGSFPSVNVNLRPRVFKDKMPLKNIKLLSEFYKEFIKHTFVNCWHINKYQSAAMWKLYLRSNEGIAIRSTVGRLKKSLLDNKHDIYIGIMKYITYSEDLIPEGSLFPYFHKRKSFEHERELRAVIQEFPRDIKGDIKWSRPPHKSGLNVDVNLEILIDRIVLAPLCPLWHKKLVESVLNRYGVNKIVRRSTLYTRDDRIVY